MHSEDTNLNEDPNLKVYSLYIQLRRGEYTFMQIKILVENYKYYKSLENSKVISSWRDQGKFRYVEESFSS